MQPSSLILLSGGLDSVYAFLKAREASSISLAITFDYGQKSAAREASHAKQLCEIYNVKHRVLTLPVFQTLTAHPLLDDEASCPSLAREKLDDKSITENSAKSVWIPNRNGVFINIAAAMAEAQNIQNIYVGFNAEEALTFPDNSAAFVESINKSLSYSTLIHVTVNAPAISMNKNAIAAHLKTLDFDFRLLWSCYLGGDKMCGVCESCQRLKRALDLNSISRHHLFVVS